MPFAAILGLIEAAPGIYEAIVRIVDDIREGNSPNAADMAQVQAGLNAEEAQAQTDMLSAIARRKAAGV